MIDMVLEAQNRREPKGCEILPLWSDVSYRRAAYQNSANCVNTKINFFSTPHLFDLPTQRLITHKPIVLSCNSFRFTAYTAQSSQQAAQIKASLSPSTAKVSHQLFLAHKKPEKLISFDERTSPLAFSPVLPS
jgi:hypothetical protein